MEVIKRNRINRALVILLAICLVFSLSMTVNSETYAASGVDKWDGTYDYTWYTSNPDADTFYIKSAEAFAGFAKIVNNKKGVSDAGRITAETALPTSSPAYADQVFDTSIPADDFIVPTDRNPATGAYTTYTQKTVILAVDIDLGGIEITPPVVTTTGTKAYTAPTYDAASKVWVPIGYNSSSGAHAAGSANGVYGRPFKGIFDGGFHEVTNLYVPALTSTGDNSSNDATPTVGDNSHAIFGDLGQAGVVKNIILRSGFVKGGRYTGGIVGRNWGTIESVANFATIETNGDRSGGGIAGVSYNNSGKARISNSYNAGYVLKGDRRNAGGIVCENEAIIENCYNIGRGMFKSGAFDLMGGIADSASGNTITGAKITNCFSLSGDGYPTVIASGVSEATATPPSLLKTAEEMKASSFITTLGSAFKADTANTNNGYPVLAGEKFTLPPDPASENTVSIVGDAFPKDFVGEIVDSASLAAAFDFPVDVSISITEGNPTGAFDNVIKGQKYFAFDITIKDKGGNVVQPKPGTSVKITLPVEADLLGRTAGDVISVGHIHKDSGFEILGSTFTAGTPYDTITFYAKSFSPYALILNYTAAGSPATGDNMNFVLYGGILVVAFVGMVLALNRRRITTDK